MVPGVHYLGQEGGCANIRGISIVFRREPYVVDGYRIKWAWLRSLAVQDNSFCAETWHKASFNGCLVGYLLILHRLFEVESS